MMLILDDIIRLAAAVAALALLSSIPAAAQAPKLSPQQLNPPTLIVNKPIAAPKAYSPNLNKPIAAPKGIAFQRPVPNRKMKTVTTPGDGPVTEQTDILGNPIVPIITYGPCPGGVPRDRMGYC
jgi:hypothetical protein